MNKTVRTAAILLTAAVALFGLRLAMIYARHPSDQELIQNALSESLEASRKGQPGSVLDLLSKQFTINQTAAPDTSQVADFVRRYKPDIRLENRHAQIVGDEARIVTAVDLGLFGQTTRLNDVMLVFRKEEGHGFLFLPTTKWHLTDIRLAESQLPVMNGP